MARITGFWKKIGDTIQPVFTGGVNLLISGANRYLNFNGTSGEPGYGIRDNGGTLQFKNESGAWTNFGSGGGGIQSVVAGTNVTVDNTDPLNPIVNATGGGGAVDSVNGQTGVVVLDADDVGAYSEAEVDTLLGAKANTADLATVATTGDYNDLSNLPDLTAFDNLSVHANEAAFPVTGSLDKLYLAEDTGELFRWTGSAYIGVSTDHAPVTLAGTPDYITISGQTITRNQIDLTTDVTGDLPFANLAQISAHTVLGHAGAGNGDAAGITMGNNTILGREGSGNVDDLSASQVRTILNVEDGAEVNNISDANATDLTDGGETTLHTHAISGVTGLQTALDGKITAFADPNADRIVFWDDSAGAFAALTASTGLTLSGTNLTVRSASETATGIAERATNAEFTTGTDTTRYVSANQVANVEQDLTNKNIISSINAQTGTTYTLVASDAGKVVTLTNASAITLTIPDDVFAAGEKVLIIQGGAGSVTITAGAGVTLNAPTSVDAEIAEEDGSRALLFTATDQVTLI
jgi:hypothetical protein